MSRIPDGRLFEGIIHRVDLVMIPEQVAYFEIHGQRHKFAAPHRLFLDLNVGDRVCVACRFDENDMPVVLDMVRASNGGAISDLERGRLLALVQASITAEEMGIDLVPEMLGSQVTFGRRILRSAFERVEVEYIKARERLVIEPVIMIDARDQNGRAARIADPPGGLPKAYCTITIGSRLQIAEMLREFSGSAAESLANDPLPEGQFTIVVLSDPKAIEFFARPEPT